MIKFEVYFTKSENLGFALNTDEFEVWKEQNPQDFEKLLEANRLARDYCASHKPESDIIDKSEGEIPTRIIDILSSMSSVRTNFANNIDYACRVEQIDTSLFHSCEEAFLNRYPGLELKDYTSTDIDVRAALFHSEVDLDNPDRKLFPEIRSAAGTIEFPITLPADFKHPEGVVAFYGLFADINFLLSGWFYEPTYAGQYGWNEIKDSG